MDRLLERYRPVKWLKQIIISFIVVLCMAVPARAAEQITTFTSDVRVQQSGRVDVTEVIVYDFGYTSRHGIYRYIPVVYKDDQATYKPGFGFDDMTLNGQPVPYKLTSEGANKVVKIGDPNRTVSGQQVYTITYHFDRLLVNKEGDLLRFNVAGSGWTVPIQEVRAKVSGPSTAKLTCYTGTPGSTAKDCSVSEATGTVTTAAIGNGSDLTIEALWPSGTVATLLEPYKDPWWVTALWIAAGIYVLTGVVLFVAACVRWLGIRYAEKRAERDQTIIAQYEPPNNLTAGEIGLLADNSLSMVEVTAMLIAAAVSGYIRIEQTAAKTLLKKAEYTLIKLKDFTGMDDAESQLLTTIFNGKSEIALKDVDRSSVPAAISSYQKAVRQKAKELGLYTAQTKFITAGAIAVIVAVVIMTLSPAIVIMGLLILPLSLWFYKRVGQTPRRTPGGLQTWAYVQGFKLFLSVTEKDRLAFTDVPERTPKQFSKLLPYAIALGVEQQWAKQFEGMDIARATGWYVAHDHRAFTAGYLVGNLHDSFASSVAVASTSPSQSSSGSFGGGFSGGGFSGGGGGSW